MTAFPTFQHKEAFQEGMQQVFGLFQPPNAEIEALLTHILLTKNTSTLIKGPCGAGKTRLIRAIAGTFFNQADEDEPDFGQVTCSQDKTPTDVLYRHDLGELMKGVEKVEPRRLVTKRLKWINELGRANHMTFNALLSLLSEYQVRFRDLLFRSPAYVCLMDANPNDSGSTAIPAAFTDRIDYSVSIPVASFDGILSLFDAVETDNGLEWDLNESHLKPVLNATQMEKIWYDVARVSVTKHVRYLCGMLSSYLKGCIKAERSRIETEFQLGCFECRHRSEACAKLLEVPGIRYIKSMVKLAQARAWMRKESEITVEDLFYGLPYTLGHRLKVKEDLLAMYENAGEWIKQDLYLNCIRGKIPRWRQAIDAVLEENSGQLQLDALPMDDMAIADLSTLAPQLKN